MLQFLRHSVVAKIAGLLLLMLLLCIPLAYIHDLNQERGQSQREAAEELARTYTGPQTLIGPLLVVPYVERWSETRRNADGKAIGIDSRSKAMTHIVFPETLHIEGTMKPQERYRGIFRIPFYGLDAQLSGGFGAFQASDIATTERDATIDIKTPYITLQMSDLRGLDGSPALTLAGVDMRFGQRSTGTASGSSEGVHATLAGEALAAWRAGQALPFALRIGLVGQETLSLVPVAGNTTALLRSTWAHPSFGGSFLASERTVTKDGFEARWGISSLVTSAQDQLRAGLVPDSNAAVDEARGASTATTAMSSRTALLNGPLQTFDVSLAQPLNVYAMSTRAGKYGALFVGLVLMAAFMFELFRQLRLHPVQYALVGLSIALFFLLLLALSEKFAFWMAYAGAAAASVLLLSIYFSAVLGGWRRGLSFGAYVALLYGALYGLLASESNALLLGALLVFGMLSLLMIATRKVDWYALSGGSAKAA